MTTSHSTTRAHDASKRWEQAVQAAAELDLPQEALRPTGPQRADRSYFRAGKYFLKVYDDSPGMRAIVKREQSITKAESKRVPVDVTEIDGPTYRLAPTVYDVNEACCTLVTEYINHMPVPPSDVFERPLQRLATAQMHRLHHSQSMPFRDQDHDHRFDLLAEAKRRLEALPRISTHQPFTLKSLATRLHYDDQYLKRVRRLVPAHGCLKPSKILWTGKPEEPMLFCGWRQAGWLPEDWDEVYTFDLWRLNQSVRELYSFWAQANLDVIKLPEHQGFEFSTRMKRLVVLLDACQINAYTLHVVEKNQALIEDAVTRLRTDEKMTRGLPLLEDNEALRTRKWSFLPWHAARRQVATEAPRPPIIEPERLNLAAEVCDALLLPWSVIQGCFSDN